MSRLPHENRNVVDRPDLPEYELNKACPVTGEVAGLEAHHLWRKSFGTPSWWVELWDGTVVGNRINLSQSAHYRITVNKARIIFDAGKFWWEEADERVELRWQPPRGQRWLRHHEEGDDGLVLSPEDEAEHLEYIKTLMPISDWKPTVPAEGEICPTCERRKPHAKKASSPKSKVFSTRIPLDDVETFNEIVDAAAEHMGAKAKPHHVYNTLLVGLTLILQAPKEQLPGG